jgi:hypothetical protein
MNKLAIVTVAALAAGCASRARNAEALLDSVRTYHEGLRWSRIPVAASRIPPDERGEFIAAWDQLGEDLRITDYEVIQVAEAERAAKVEVKYTWYLDSRQIVHETRVGEDWEKKGEVWIRVGERRLRGEPMPGLPDPDDDRGADVSRDDSVEARGD